MRQFDAASLCEALKIGLPIVVVAADKRNELCLLLWIAICLGRGVATTHVVFTSDVLQKPH